MCCALKKITPLKYSGNLFPKKEKKKAKIIKTK
jgi:hypothetical protein